MVCFKGNLKLSLLRGHGLRSGNAITVRNSQCNLYFVITIGNETFRSTPYIGKYEPVWNEACIFPIDYDGKEIVYVHAYVHYSGAEIQGLNAKPGEDRCIAVYANELVSILSNPGPHWYLLRRLGSFEFGGTEEAPGEVTAEVLLAVDWIPTIKTKDCKLTKLRVPAANQLTPTDVPTSPINNTEQRSKTTPSNGNIKKFSNSTPSPILSAPPQVPQSIKPSNPSRSNDSTKSSPSTSSTPPTYALDVPSSQSGLKTSISHPSIASLSIAETTKQSTDSPSEQSTSSTPTPHFLSGTPIPSNGLRKISSSPSMNNLPSQAAIPLTQSFHEYRPMTELLKFPLPTEAEKKYPLTPIPRTPPVFTSQAYGRILQNTQYFNDLDFLEGYAGLSRIMEVIVWGDFFINGFQVIYNIRGLRVPGPRRGLSTLSPTILTLGEGEYIVSVGIRKNETIITGLTIVTSACQRKEIGSIPNAELSENCACNIPRNHRVVGFHGGASASGLNNIGVLYQSLTGATTKSM